MWTYPGVTQTGQGNATRIQPTKHGPVLDLGRSRRAAVRPPRLPSSHCWRGSTDLAAVSARRKEEPVCDAHRGPGVPVSTRTHKRCVVLLADR